MRSRSGLGKKQGVSESRNCTCVPHASSMRRKRARYFSAVKPALNCLRREGIMSAAQYACASWRPERRSSEKLQRPRNRKLQRSRILGFHQELSILHDLLVVDPDVELPAHDIDVGRRIPLRAGMGAVGIPKRNMDARIFLVLQNLADHVLQIDV